MNVYGVIKGKLTPSGTLTASLTGKGVLEGSLTVPSSAGVDKYQGEYEFTPSEDTQIIEIDGLRATQDITINPIPSNYGLITYSGSGITVS